MTNQEQEQARWWFAQPLWADRIRMFRGTRKTTRIQGEMLVIHHLDVRANLVIEVPPSFMGVLRDCMVYGDLSCNNPDVVVENCYILGKVSHPHSPNVRRCVVFQRADHEVAAWAPTVRVEPYPPEVIP